jgi:hypothetical protein
MNNKLLLFTGILILATALASAKGDKDQEPWKNKPYDKWNQKEVSIVLNNSPWAVQARVTAEWLAKKGHGSGSKIINLQMQTANDTMNPPETSAPSSPGMPANRSGPSGPAPTPEGAGLAAEPDAPTVYFAVRWDSSRVMREALAQNLLLAGQVKPAAVAEYLSQIVENYELAVAGTDMTPFASVTPDDLKAGSYLEVSPSKRKVFPASVVIKKFPDGQKINSVVFSFSKQIENGEPLIRPDDTTAQFHCKTKLLDLAVTFEIRQMVLSNTPDL